MRYSSWKIDVLPSSLQEALFRMLQPHCELLHPGNSKFLSAPTCSQLHLSRLSVQMNSKFHFGLSQSFPLRRPAVPRPSSAVPTRLAAPRTRLQHWTKGWEISSHHDYTLRQPAGPSVLIFEIHPGDLLHSRGGLFLLQQQGVCLPGRGQLLQREWLLRTRQM